MVVDNADKKAVTRISRALDDIHSQMVATRRGMMLFRSRMDRLEQTVDSIGDGLAKATDTFTAILKDTELISEKCRETTALCDAITSNDMSDK